MLKYFKYFFIAWNISDFEIQYSLIRQPCEHNTGCPTRYRTRHFYNNFTNNEDIATKFEADLPHCVRNVTTTNVLLFKFRCNIFIGVRIIKEMSGSVTSGTPCIYGTYINAFASTYSPRIYKFFVLRYKILNGVYITWPTRVAR
jgi:hypothetical protein